jgi:hypothetical protein
MDGLLSRINKSYGIILDCVPTHMVITEVETLLELQYITMVERIRLPKLDKF